MNLCLSVIDLLQKQDQPNHDQATDSHDLEHIQMGIHLRLLLHY